MVETYSCTLDNKYPIQLRWCPRPLPAPWPGVKLAVISEPLEWDVFTAVGCSKLVHAAGGVISFHCFNARRHTCVRWHAPPELRPSCLSATSREHSCHVLLSSLRSGRYSASSPGHTRYTCLLGGCRNYATLKPPGHFSPLALPTRSNRKIIISQSENKEIMISME